jgi:hypothetical protein
MAALDSCEPQIIRALQKAGWAILNKPFMLRTDERTVFADFTAQRAVNGSTKQVIVLEVKCFANPQNDLPDLYTAIGQYLFYQAALVTRRLMLPVYLALPVQAYERLIRDSTVLAALQQAAIKLLIVDIDGEEIVQWTD